MLWEWSALCFSSTAGWTNPLYQVFFFLLIFNNQCNTILVQPNNYLWLQLQVWTTNLVQPLFKKSKKTTEQSSPYSLTYSRFPFFCLHNWLAALQLADIHSCTLPSHGLLRSNVQTIQPKVCAAELAMHTKNTVAELATVNTKIKQMHRSQADTCFAIYINKKRVPLLTVWANHIIDCL